MADPGDNEIRIRHDQDDFIEGQKYILTMKDQPLLAGDDINDEEEELINVDLASVQKQKHVIKAKAKLSRGNKLAYDTNEIDQYGQIKRQALLDKYDMEEEEKEGMLLSLKNNKIRNKFKKITEEKIEGGERNEMTVKKIFKSDFAIEDQPLNLGGSKTFKKKGKKRNLKKNKKILENIDELLADDPLSGESGDLKTREERMEEMQQSEKRNQEMQELKRENYNKAVLKANLKTNKMFKADEEEDEDYQLIQKSIEKQRKLLAAKQNETKKSDKAKKAEDALLSILNETNEEETFKKQNNDEFLTPIRREPVKSKWIENLPQTPIDAKEITDISDISKSSIQTEQDRQNLAQIL